MHIDFISLAQLLNKNIVSGFVISDSLTKVNQVVGTVTNPQVRFASSMKNSTQFSNTSKYEAIQKLAQKWNLTNDQIMTIGDSLNDLEMIARVKYGIVVANGQPELKKVAFATTDAWDQDGVAKAIGKYFYNL